MIAFQPRPSLIQRLLDFLENPQIPPGDVHPQTAESYVQRATRRRFELMMQDPYLLVDFALEA
jgi:hypothetical protein